MVLNETTYANLLAANPTRKYGIYNNKVYDFTDFYAAIGESTPSSVQDVTDYNTSQTIADAITIASESVVNNIFSLVLNVPANPGNYLGVFRLAAPNDTYDPINSYNNPQIRAGDLLIPNKYIIRWGNVFYDITYCIISSGNIPIGSTRYADNVNFSDIFTLPSSARLNNQTVFNRLIELNWIIYPGIITFIQYSNNSFNTAVSADYFNGVPSIKKYAVARPWNLLANTVQGTGNVKSGLAVAFSKDGTTYAYCERSIAGNDTSPLNVKIYRRITGNWVPYGTNFTIPMSTFITDAELADPKLTRQILGLSDNGQTLIVGDYKFGALDGSSYPGRVKVYDIVGNTWTIRGAPIDGDLAIDKGNFGITAALSGDGKIFVASSAEINPTSPPSTSPYKNARVYEYQTNTWVQLGSTLNNVSGDADQPLGLTSNFDGSIIAIGDPTSTGSVVIFERIGLNYNVQITLTIGPNLSSSIQNFGRSLELDKTGTTLVVGAPGTSIYNAPLFNSGAVLVYKFTSSWARLGNVIYGRPGDELGFNVSISSDGSNIAASARKGDSSVTGDPSNVLDTGYVQVYKYDSTTNLPDGIWDQYGAYQTRGVANGLSYNTRLSGSGLRLLMASPGVNSGAGDIRVLYFPAAALLFEVEVYDNEYDFILGSNVSGNFITDIGLDGTDSSITGTLSVNSVNVGSGFVALSSLANNTTNPANGYQKQALISGGTIYFNLPSNSNNGSFRYESNGAQLITIPQFQYKAISNSVVSNPATVTLNSNIAPLTTVPAGPVLPQLTYTRNANGGANFLQSGTSTIVVTASGGVNPYVFTTPITSSTIGSVSATLITPTQGRYVFNPNQYNVVSDTSANFFLEVEDSDAPTTTVSLTLPVRMIVNPTLSSSILNGSVTRQIGVTNYITSKIDSATNPIVTSGGTPTFTYSAFLPVIGKYGTLNLNPNGSYTYTPFTATSTPVSPLQSKTSTFSDTDIFNIQVVDATGDSRNFTYTINVNVVPQSGITPIPNGNIYQFVNGNTQTTQGLTGSIVLIGPTAVSYGIIGSSSSPRGSLSVNSVTGVFSFTPAPITVYTTVTSFTDTFTLTATTAASVVFSTTYNVVLTVTPQLLFSPITPSAGAVGYNVNRTTSAFTSNGLTNRFTLGNGVPPYSFDITGSILSGTSLKVSNGTYGNMSINIFTGDFDYNVTFLPPTAGNYSDTFQIVARDSNSPQNTNTLNYVINFTISSTDLGILPVFSDAVNRSLLNYWNFIVHDSKISNITSIISIQSTEVVVVGQTDSRSPPYADVNPILKQLLTGTLETQSSFDVLTNILNNTQTALTTPTYDAARTYSFSLRSGTTITELSDIISLSHKNFLLNRARTNVCESGILFYFDSTIPIPFPVTPVAPLDRIFNQVNMLFSLGVRNIISVIIATSSTRNPATDTTYADELATKQNAVLNYISSINPGINLIPASVRYDAVKNVYQNVGVTNLNGASTGTLDGSPSYILNTAYGPTQMIITALSTVIQTIKDSDYASDKLRIVITSVDTTNNTATGEILYSQLPTVGAPTLYTSSRLFTDNTRTISCSRVDLPVTEAQNQKQIIVFNQGSVGKNISQLKPGDIVYALNRTPIFVPPSSMTILVAVVSGVTLTPVTGTDIFMQIGDGVKYPNNPVFKGVISSIVSQIDSVTFRPVVPVNPSNTIVYGSNYYLNITNIESTLGGGGLELFTSFPSLGFITIYFGRASNGVTGVGPYGRGMVTSLTRV